MADFVRYVFCRRNKSYPYGRYCACCGKISPDEAVFTYVSDPTRTTFTVCRYTCSYVVTTFDDLCSQIGKLTVGVRYG